MTDEALIDPLGRRVILRDRTWFGHIVKGHPEVAEHRGLVEDAVRSPEEVRHSRSDDNCRVYLGQGPRETVRIMVVADVNAGVVKTAHLCKKPSGGALEWSKSTPSKEP